MYHDRNVTSLVKDVECARRFDTAPTPLAPRSHSGMPAPAEALTLP